MAINTFSSLHMTSAATDGIQSDLVKANQTCILNMVQTKQRCTFYQSLPVLSTDFEEGLYKISIIVVQWFGF